MRKTLALIGTLCLLLPLAGCAQNPMEVALGETEAALAETSKSLNQLTKELEDALKGSTGQLDKDKLDAAIKEAKKLKEAGDKMMATQVAVDNLKGKLTDSERLTLIDQFKGSLTNKFDAVNSAFNNLTAAMAAVEKRATKSAYEELQKAYREGKEKYEIIAKAR